MLPLTLPELKYWSQIGDKIGKPINIEDKMEEVIITQAAVK